MNKKQLRVSFRQGVLYRDDHLCRVCNKRGNMDAHHITDRNEMPNGGYCLSNGITLCSGGVESCHFKAEIWHSSLKNTSFPGYHPDDLYALIGSSYEKAMEDSFNLEKR